MKKTKQLISIIIPVYNEQDSLQEFYKQLCVVIQKIQAYTFELVFVDDGSKDSSEEIVTAICLSDSSARLISLSRNYGKEVALTAGIQYANGEAILSIDSDGQHPAELIPIFIQHWEKGSDVVIGVRDSNQDEGFIKKYGSKLFYIVFNNISENEIIPRSTDFRLISREVADEFLKIKNRNRITRGLIDSLGYRRTTVRFNANSRIGGVASYSSKKLLSLAINSFVSLSFAPLRILIRIGVSIITLSIVLGLFMLVEGVLLSNALGLDITGTAYLACLLLFLTGTILVGQGISSIYIADVYHTAANVPLYSVSKKRSLRL